MPKLKPNQFYLSGHLITELPILFQTEMVQANMEDRKTQTRREKGLGYFNADPDFWFRKGNPRRSSNKFWDSNKEANPNPLSISFGFSDPLGNLEYVKCPYGKPGDLLWVRETWQDVKCFDYHMEGFGYKATKSDKEFADENNISWKPSIHMPKSAARLWLMVEDIRVERVQDITEEDAKAEGIEFKFIPLFQEVLYRCYSSTNKIPYQGFPRHWASNWGEAISSFLSLWESINGKKSRDADRWVWVVQYRILSKTGRPSPDTILENYLQITGKEKEVTHV